MPDDNITFTVTMPRDAAVWWLFNHGLFSARRLAEREVDTWTPGRRGDGAVPAERVHPGTDAPRDVPDGGY